jgi:23S rRNA (guanine745-N1)-methyltransferase
VTAGGTTPGDRAAPRFRCPACRQPLAAADSGLRCPNGHHVDRSREGYVNLLPSGGRRPAGDDAAAVHARRALLDRGHYAPVARAVADAVAEATAAARPGAVLDAGCGEGTYLAAVTAATGTEGWGVDVSKPAVRLAARRHRAHRYAVASSLDLPFEDAVFDAVVSVFAPRAFAEFSRVLRPGGAIVLASPAAARPIRPGPDQPRRGRRPRRDDPVAGVRRRRRPAGRPDDDSRRLGHDPRRRSTAGVIVS